MLEFVRALLLTICALGFIGCNNQKANVSGFKQNSSSNFKASAANPINASSYGAAAGTTADGHVVKIKVSSLAINPNTPTAGGYSISAKAAKW